MDESARAAGFVAEGVFHLAHEAAGPGRVLQRPEPAPRPGGVRGQPDMNHAGRRYAAVVMVDGPLMVAV